MATLEEKVQKLQDNAGAVAKQVEERLKKKFETTTAEMVSKHDASEGSLVKENSELHDEVKRLSTSEAALMERLSALEQQRASENESAQQLLANTVNALNAALSAQCHGGYFFSAAPTGHTSARAVFPSPRAVHISPRSRSHSPSAVLHADAPASAVERHPLRKGGDGTSSSDLAEGRPPTRLSGAEHGTPLQPPVVGTLASHSASPGTASATSPGTTSPTGKKRASSRKGHGARLACSSAGSTSSNSDRTSRGGATASAGSTSMLAHPLRK